MTTDKEKSKKTMTPDEFRGFIADMLADVVIFAGIGMGVPIIVLLWKAVAA